MMMMRDSLKFEKILLTGWGNAFLRENQLMLIAWFNHTWILRLRHRSAQNDRVSKESS